MHMKRLAALAALLGTILFIPQVTAQVLETVELESLPDTSLIRARFSEPVLYVKHFPEQTGSTLLIFVRALKLGESTRPGTRTRKSIHGTPNAVLPLLGVTFEIDDGPEGSRLVLKFKRDVRFSVKQGRDGRSIEIEVEKPILPKPAERPAVAVPAAERVFALTLQSSPEPIPGLAAARAKLKDLPGTAVYQAQTKVVDKEMYVLRLGFFSSQAEAEAARAKLLGRYPAAQVTEVTVDERRTAPPVAVAPAPKAAPVPTPAPAPTGPIVVAPESTEQALEQARAALTRGDNLTAIQIFTQLLERPAGAHSQEASELLGLARERNKQPELAEVEYRLYLKLYPQGEGAERVRQRLANLLPPDSVELKAARAPDEEGRMEISGSLSQLYYRGNSTIDTTDKTGPTIGEQNTLSLVDQSAIVNILDVNARYRTRRYDNRAVLSADYTYDFLSNTDTARWRSAYGEVKDRELNYSARLGRQPAASGVLTRFDGGLFNYKFTPKFGMNLVAGTPYDTVAPDSHRSFYGASMDLGGAGGGFSSNLYFFRQEIDGITDREAVGTELRYFRENAAIFSLIDYETAYNELNIFLVNGNWQLPGGTAFNILYDYRRSPPLQTSNALLGETVTSISGLLATRTEDQIRQDALDRTPKTKVFFLSVLHPLNPSLQIGGDIIVANIGGTPASGALPATQGTGNVITYTPKIIASNLLFNKDVTIASAGLSTSDAFDATSVAIQNRAVTNKWRFDTGLRYYRQANIDGSLLTRWTPTLKVDYLWLRDLTLEVEFGEERSRTSGTATDEVSKRDFFTLGYRWVF